MLPPEPLEEGPDNSRDFSLQELIHENTNGDDMDPGAATGSQGEISVATAALHGHGVEEPCAGARKQLPGHVVGRRVVRLDNMGIQIPLLVIGRRTSRSCLHGSRTRRVYTLKVR